MKANIKDKEAEKLMGKKIQNCYGCKKPSRKLYGWNLCISCVGMK